MFPIPRFTPRMDGASLGRLTTTAHFMTVPAIIVARLRRAALYGWTARVLSAFKMVILTVKKAMLASQIFMKRVVMAQAAHFRACWGNEENY